MNPLNIFKKNKHPLAIAAIFRNEKDYILEWLAWHRSQGVQHFIIYDNHSDDGTTELLQQLNEANLVHFHSIEQQEKVQLKAYCQILKEYKDKFELLAFIDADEFIMPMGKIPASTVINDIFKDEKVGGLAINWRIFGTNGHQNKPEGFTLLNYNMAANDQRSRNHFIKSIYRTRAVTQIFAHMGAVKKAYRYINTQGDDLIFSTHNTLPNPTENNKRTGVVQTISNSKLRINHYALKSLEEFNNKKKFRGDAMFGKESIKTDNYIKAFDINDEKILIEKEHIEAFKKEYDKLNQQLNK